MQKTIIQLEDDLDGGKATETVSFALDGVEYQIDLSERNANKLRNSLGDFIAHARRVGGRAKRGTAAKAGPFDGIDTKAVRAWAESNGIKVNQRGRISADVVDKYRAAGH